MRTLTLTLLLAACAFPVGTARAQHAGHAPSAYAGEETRAVKALSPEEVAAYLEGQGMGLARAAELNHYPGPKHVLELADALHLTAAQRQAAETLVADVRARAAALGAQVVAAERRLDALFAGGTADAEHLQALLHELARLQAELRFVHLEAHIQMRAALTEHQVARYDALRGYTGGAAPAHDGHH